MLELIALICGTILLFYIPLEANKVRHGWVRKRYKGPHGEFRAAYLKQLTFLMWVGVGIAAANLALAPLSSRHGDWVVKLIGAVIWLTVGVLSFYERRRLARA